MGESLGERTGAHRRTWPSTVDVLVYGILLELEAKSSAVMSRIVATTGMECPFLYTGMGFG